MSYNAPITFGSIPLNSDIVTLIDLNDYFGSERPPEAVTMTVGQFKQDILDLDPEDDIPWDEAFECWKQTLGDGTSNKVLTICIGSKVHPII